MNKRMWICGAALMVSGGWTAQALAGASASNFRAESRLGANYWNANSAIDGNLETAWMVPGNSENVGEHITIDVPKGSVDKIGMRIGFVKDEETFNDYARVKSIKIEFFQENNSFEMVRRGDIREVTFEDQMDFQVIDFEDVLIESEMGGGQVRITVTEIYPGRDYPNFAMGEVLVFMGEMDAAPVVSAVSSEVDNHISMDMTDDNPRTFWAGDIEGASVTFAAAGYTLSRVGLTPGPSSYARPKKVEIIANHRTHIQELPDTNTVHWIDIPATQGYTGSAWGNIQMNILEVHPGSNPQVSIAELDLKATAYEGL